MTSSNSGTTNAFIWDTSASQLLADSTHDYVYVQSSVTPDLQINLTTGTVDLLIQDQNANTRGVVQIVGANSTFDGTIVNYTDYDAYGNAITQPGGSINPGGMSNGGVATDISTSFAFGAGYWDASNLTYLVHRYLDNETGQFISVDPLVDQTREAYVYAGDGPVMATDALGQWSSSCIVHLQWPHISSSNIKSGKGRYVSVNAILDCRETMAIMNLNVSLWVTHLGVKRILRTESRTGYTGKTIKLMHVEAACRSKKIMTFYSTFYASALAFSQIWHKGEGTSKSKELTCGV